MIQTPSTSHAEAARHGSCSCRAMRWRNQRRGGTCFMKWDCILATFAAGPVIFTSVFTEGRSHIILEIAAAATTPADGIAQCLSPATCRAPRAARATNARGCSYKRHVTVACETRGDGRRRWAGLGVAYRYPVATCDCHWLASNLPFRF